MTVARAFQELIKSLNLTEREEGRQGHQGAAGEAGAPGGARVPSQPSAIEGYVAVRRLPDNE